MKPSRPDWRDREDNIWHWIAVAVIVGFTVALLLRGHGGWQ